MKKNLWCFFIVFGLASACSKSSGKKGSSGPGPEPEPSSPEEAMARLSPEHRQNFDSWKASLVKSCSAKQAFSDFSLKDLETEKGFMVGLDATLMVNANSGSLVYSSGDSTAIINSYDVNYVEEKGSHKTSESFNGKTYSLVSETRRQGINCEVYVFGQKVYETKIASSFNIGFGLEDKGSQTTIETKRKPNVTAIGLIGLGELKSQDLTSALETEFKPSEASRNLVAKELDIPESIAKKVLTLNGRGQGTFSFRAKSGGPSIWTSAFNMSVIDPIQNLKSVETDGTTSLALEARFALPKIQVGKDVSSKDVGTYRINLQAEILKKGDSFTTKILSSEAQGVAAFDEGEARECIINRALGLRVDPVSSYIIAPGPGELIEPCQPLSEDIYALAMTGGAFKSLIPTMFESVRPSSDFRYGGWDRVLSDLAIKAMEGNKDILAEFDPEGATTVVPRLAANMERLRAPLAESKNLHSEKNAVLRMGMGWAFRGVDLSESFFERILAALDNALSPFKNSTLALMEEIGKRPATPTEIEYALSIDDAFKNHANLALSLSKEIGYSEFEGLFNQVLQMQVSPERMRLWPEHLGEIKNALVPFSALGTIKSSLIGNSIFWLQTNVVEYRELAQIYGAINNVSDTFPESTKSLLAALQKSPKSEPESLAYAAQLTKDMKDLAISIEDRSQSLDLTTYGESFFKSILQKRPSADELKNHHDSLGFALEFKAEEKARLGASNDSHMSNRNLNDLLSLAVNERWEKRDFDDAVAISQLGLDKSSWCSSKVGVSDILECVGRGLTSKAKGKFLDPAFGSRYGQLAKTFKSYLPELTKKTSFTKDKILSEFFNSSGPVWNKCDATAFSEKAKTIDQTMVLLGKETNQIKIWELKETLEEGLKNCP